MSLVQQDHGCVMQECPRDTDPLFFSAGQRIAEFSDFGVVAVWQCHDEIMYGRLLRRLHNFFPRRAGFCNSDVVRNRIVEQMCLLRHIAFHMRRYFVGISRTSAPSTETRPVWTSQKRIRSFKIVDFPEPLAPWMPVRFFPVSSFSEY